MSFNNAAVLSETIKCDELVCICVFLCFGHYIKLHQCCVKIRGCKDYREAEHLPWYKKVSASTALKSIQFMTAVCLLKMWQFFIRENYTPKLFMFR